MTTAAAPALTLPAPVPGARGALEDVLRRRRSVREYGREPLTRAQLGQLLWAAQGVTDAEGLRTAPSAGALYPLEVRLVVGRAADLAAGVYRYRPAGHAAQNVCLEAVALGLGSVVVGAFDDGAVARVAGLGRDEAPLCLIAVGPARRSAR